MKKFFSLFAAVLMAGSMMAGYEISFSQAAAKGSLDGAVFGEGLTLTITDNNSDSTKRKVEVDANTAYFGDAESKTSFNYRLKTGAKSGSNNQMSLVVPEYGVLIICARTSSSAATDRNIVVTDANGTEVINHILLDTEMVEEQYTDEQGATQTRKIFTPVSAAVSAGTYTITYPAGAINIYAISLETENEEDDPEPEFNYFLVGTLAENGWDLAQAMPMAGDSIVRHMAAGTYEFKVTMSQTSWDAAMGYESVDANCSSAGIRDNGGNIKVTLSEEGDVKVKVTGSGICVTGVFGEVEPVQPIYSAVINNDPDYIFKNEFTAQFLEYADSVVIKGFDGTAGHDLVLTWDTVSWTGINGKTQPWVNVNATTSGTDYYGAYLYASYIGGTWYNVENGNIYIGGYFYDSTSASTWGYINYNWVIAPTALRNEEITEKAVKRIENGQLVIIKNGVRYNANGMMVK